MPGIGLTPNLLHVGLLSISRWVKWCGSDCTSPVPKPLGVKSNSAGMVTLGVLGVPEFWRGCNFGGVNMSRDPGPVRILGPKSITSCKIQGGYVMTVLSRLVQL